MRPGHPDKDYTDGYLGDGVLGETNGDPDPDSDLKEPRDGVVDGVTKPSAESSLAKSEAIRLAAKCIRDAEPNTKLELDAKSAVARYYHKSKAYNGNSLWLVGFPETGRKGTEDRDGEDKKAVLYRMAWVNEDGSYSGNCQGELPPTNPPVLLGPDDETKAIRIAKGFLLRHYPKIVAHRPPTATFNTDNRSFGGGPMWIVGFDPRTKAEAANGPPHFCYGVDVTLDGAVMLGACVAMGPTRAAPKDGANPPQ